MKKQELQKILKPLIKQCIKEVIFEEGVLSGLISEVVQGLGQQTIVEAKTRQPEPVQQDFSRQNVELQEEAREAMQAKKRKLEESLGGGFKGVFENVAPLSKGGSPGESSAQSPLANYAPGDPGIDISGIMALGRGKNWKNMI